MKNTKRRMEHFSFYDHTGIALHLEKMAEKGWLLDSHSNFTWKYRRIEPAKLHFAVTYFPGASEFDPEPSDGQKTFEDFCAEAGWRHLFSSAQMQIFVSREKNPVPIETDALLQVETIHKAMKKNYLPSHLLMLLVGLLNMGLFLSRLLGDPIGVLVENSNLFTFFCWLLVIFLSLTELSSYFIWRHRAMKEAVENGGFLKTHSSSKKLNDAVLILLFFGLLYWIASSRTPRERLFILVSFLYIGLLILMMTGVKKLLKQKKASAKVNRTATIITSFVFSFAIVLAIPFVIMNSPGRNLVNRVPAETYEYNGHTWEIYHDDIPLTVEDLTRKDLTEKALTVGDLTGGDESPYSEWMDKKSSLLIDQLKASQDRRFGAGDLPELSYTVNTVKLPFLYDFCLNGLSKRYSGRSSEPEEYRNHMVSVNPAPWEADAVYRLYEGKTAWNRYLICWGNKIVELDFNWEVTEEQIAAAAKKLKDL